MTTSTPCILTLHALELFVFLGWPDAEIQHPQRVLCDIVIHFPTAPAACLTDDLQDTLSYDVLIEYVQQQTAASSYRLLEHLSYAIQHMIQMQLPAVARVVVNVTKFPAIPALTGGASFQYGV